MRLLTAMQTPTPSTESRRLKKENIFPGFPHPWSSGTPAPLPGQPPVAARREVGGGGGRPASLLTPKLGGALALERLAACRFYFF